MEYPRMPPVTLDCKEKLSRMVLPGVAPREQRVVTVAGLQVPADCETSRSFQYCNIIDVKFYVKVWTMFINYITRSLSLVSQSGAA